MDITSYELVCVEMSLRKRGGEMRVESAPLKGHPQGVPCAELSPQVTEGYFRKTSHIKQKIPQNPSTV